MRAIQLPPNDALQQTFDPSALFAGAKSTAASSAAELGRYKVEIINE